MLMHTGERFLQSRNGLLSTAAAQPGGDLKHPQYALEGSVFIGGAVVQWLRDGLRAIDSSAQIQALAESVPDAGGVMFVPALPAWAAPYWKARCARHHHGPRGAARWRTSRAQRWRASPSRARPCCRP
jgi:glycerol kinase